MNENNPITPDDNAFIVVSVVTASLGVLGVAKYVTIPDAQWPELVVNMGVVGLTAIAIIDRIHERTSRNLAK